MYNDVWQYLEEENIYWSSATIEMIIEDDCCICGGDFIDDDNYVTL